jgi:hypothetical protein
MSICVAFNLSDGLVMAVDSATTMSDAAGNTTKVFLDADKLFQLGALRIGIATFGVAALDGRTIGSFIREFHLKPENSDLERLSIREIAERLRVFFFEAYKAFAEKVYAVPFDQIPLEKKGALGLVVGGFSPQEFQSELWEVSIPRHDQPYSAKQWAAPGTTTFVWFASALPITRYLKGYDPALAPKIFTKFETILGRKMTNDEEESLRTSLAEHEFVVKVAGMPIQSGIACARFLIDFVLGHYRFVETHPIVGGKAKVGVVAYDHSAFRILE